MHIGSRGKQSRSWRAPCWTLLLTGVAMVSAASAPSTEAGPAVAEDWRALEEADLVAVHDALRVNAAFMVSPRDSEAPKQWLETGLRAARLRLSQAIDEEEAHMVVEGYVAGFQDPHVGILRLEPATGSEALWWPRFAVRWRGGAYEVAHSERGSAGPVPPVGAVLIACDGVSSGEFADRVVQRERTQPLSRYDPIQSALSLFVDADRAGRNRPFECVFRIDERDTTYKLEWVQLSAATLKQATAASVFTPAAPFGLAKWGETGWWIGAPDMASHDEWLSLYGSVEHHLSALRNSLFVIIDLRGNKGGNSAYGDWLVNLLWGPEIARYYRVKPGKVIYNTGPLVRQWIKVHSPHHLAPFDEAVKSGRNALVIDQVSQTASTDPTNPVKGKVYVLTDHACQSSCLNLLDQLLHIPDVSHVGTQTGADTIFGDLLETPLPSGRRVLYFPVKAWVDRQRSSGESLKPRPDLTWRGDLRDVDSLYRWLWRIVSSEEPQLTRLGGPSISSGKGD